MAFIATIDRDGREIEIGVARFTPGSKDGWFEFAVVVADGWHGQGIGTRLLQQLFAIARGAGANGIEGSVLKENHRMLELVKSLGFSVSPDKEDPAIACVVKAF